MSPKIGKYLNLSTTVGHFVKNLKTKGLSPILSQSHQVFQLPMSKLIKKNNIYIIIHVPCVRDGLEPMSIFKYNPNVPLIFNQNFTVKVNDYDFLLKSSNNFAIISKNAL